MNISFASNKLLESESMASSFQSGEINLHRKKNFSIHSIFTGTPNGSMYIAVSIDNSNWIVLADSAQAISEAGDVFYNVDVAGYSYAKLHYTAVSGTGSCSSFFDAKGEI